MARVIRRTLDWAMARGYPVPQQFVSTAFVACEDDVRRIVREEVANALAVTIELTEQHLDARVKSIARR